MNRRLREAMRGERSRLRRALRAFPSARRPAVARPLRVEVRRAAAWWHLRSELEAVAALVTWAAGTFGTLAVVGRQATAAPWVVGLSPLLAMLFGLPLAALFDALFRRMVAFRWLRKVAPEVFQQLTPVGIAVTAVAAAVGSVSLSLAHRSTLFVILAMSSLSTCAAVLSAYPAALSARFVGATTSRFLRWLNPRTYLTSLLLQTIGSTMHKDPDGRAHLATQLVEIAHLVEHRLYARTRSKDPTIDWAVRQELRRIAVDYRSLARQVILRSGETEPAIAATLAFALSCLAMGLPPRVLVSRREQLDVAPPRFRDRLPELVHTAMVAGLPLGSLAGAHSIGMQVPDGWFVGTTLWAVIAVIARSDEGARTISRVGDAPKILAGIPGLGGRT